MYMYNVHVHVQCSCPDFRFKCPIGSFYTFTYQTTCKHFITHVHHVMSETSVYEMWTEDVTVSVLNLKPICYELVCKCKS
jgi:hypothetical protein